MSYIAIGCLFDTPHQAAVALIGEWLTAGGLNDDDEILSFLKANTNAEILQQLKSDDWLTNQTDKENDCYTWVNDQTHSDWLEAIAETREDFPTQ